MISRAQKIRAGIFFFLSTFLLVGFLFLVVGKTLFRNRDYYYITYNNTSVNGLQLGSAVKYYGITIGRVEDIKFTEDNLNDVVVEISVKAGTPIREDVKAALSGVGVTGLKQIEITGGSDDAEILEPGSEIESGQSMISDITGKAEIIAEKSELLINNLNHLTNPANREKIANILASTDNLMENLNRIIEENTVSVRSLVANSDTISVKMKDLLTSTDLAVNRINDILMSDEIDNILANTEAVTDSIRETKIKKLINYDIVNSINNLNRAVKQMNDTFTHIDLTVLNGRDDFLNMIKDVEETLEYLREFSRQINENPSALIR